MAELTIRTRKLLTPLNFASTGRWAGLSILVGVVAGLGAILFYLLSHTISRFTLGFLAGYDAGGPAHEMDFAGRLFETIPGEPLLWLLILIPTVGGLLAGFIVFTWAPEAEGHGTDAAIDSYHRKRGRIPLITPVIKLIASSITLGTGGSGGREGPIALIGAGFGSWVSTKLHLSARERRVLLAAGIAGGIGAIFRAPLAAALFASEVLYRESEFEADVLIPSMLSSCTAYVTFGILGLVGEGHVVWTSMFSSTQTAPFQNPLDLVPYTALAIVVAVCAYIYIKIFYGLYALNKRLPGPPHIKPAIGGLLAGSLAVGMYLLAEAYWPALKDSALSVLSYGYGLLQTLLAPTGSPWEGVGHMADGSFPIGIVLLLLMIAFGKMLTTSFTLSSGGSAGVFGPSMVIGGALGGAVGVAAHAVFGPSMPSVASFVVLGMAGFFSAAARTPISTIVMVSEITGNYDLLLPALWVCALAFILQRKATLYIKQARNRTDSPAHRGDFVVNLLEGLTVRDVFRRYQRSAHPVHACMSLAQVIERITHTDQHYFPVVDDNERLVGIFSLNDIREVLHDHQGLDELVTASDIMHPHVIALLKEESLGQALEKLSHKADLPVIDEEQHVVGMLSHREVMATYTQLLHSYQRFKQVETLPDDAPGLSERLDSISQSDGLMPRFPRTDGLF